MPIEDDDITTYPPEGEGGGKRPAEKNPAEGFGFEADEGSLSLDSSADGSATTGADFSDVVIPDGHGPADSQTGSGVGVAGGDGGADGAADVGVGGTFDSGMDAAPGPGAGDSGSGSGEPGAEDGGSDGGAS